MHFWIDKRSQCAYTGRHRVPSSLSAGRARGRVCAGGAGLGVGARKGMAAPVHRFAAVDCPPRRPHRTHRHYAPPPMPAVHASRRGDESSLYVEIPAREAAPEQPTIASLAAARSVTPDTLLRTAALGLHHTPMMAPHLKFGMLVSFALATVFLAGAKYYFDRQVVRRPNASPPPRSATDPRLPSHQTTSPSAPCCPRSGPGRQGRPRRRRRPTRSRCSCPHGTPAPRRRPTAHSASSTHR